MTWYVEASAVPQHLSLPREAGTSAAAGFLSGLARDGHRVRQVSPSSFDVAARAAGDPALGGVQVIVSVDITGTARDSRVSLRATFWGELDNRRLTAPNAAQRDACQAHVDALAQQLDTALRLIAGQPRIGDVGIE